MGIVRTTETETLAVCLRRGVYETGGSHNFVFEKIQDKMVKCNILLIFYLLVIPYLLLFTFRKLKHCLDTVSFEKICN